ncbi:MAG TPA: hypothetical protein H9694_03905 [Firmicutes bacterium]|nr:hypothetical protein [Bacillota bacterium]
MTNTAVKCKRAIGSVLAAFALAAGMACMPASAASPGVYTAAAASHYKHPTTGTIEDSGGEGSYVLGQSMTESALNKSALVEVDSSGNTWVTIRLNLMDNIEDPQFQVDANRDGSFSSVSAAVMQEDFTENTTDFRMPVPSENAIIRCNMYVIPMGREVIFYITVGSLAAGSGDFVTSVKAEEPAQEPDPEPEQPASTTPDAQTSAADAPDTQTPSSEAPASEAPSTTPETSAGAAGSTSPTQDGESTVGGLAEFDASGNEVSGAAAEAQGNGGAGSPVTWWVIGGILVLAAAGGCVWYFGFFRRKKRG